MARRTSRLAASATTTIADGPTVHDPSNDPINLDIPEQLLTPEASRSETSSNNENAPAEDPPATRRRSTRTIRASLRATEALENTPSQKHTPSTSTSQAYVDRLAASKRSRSGLRHSIAVMESLHNGSTHPKDVSVADDQSIVPDTPISNSSQDVRSDGLNTSFQQRTLRSRVEKILSNDDKLVSAKPTLNIGSHQSPRRSTRITMFNKASELLSRANTVLGKRTRDPSSKGKEVGRRASLRPRNVAPAKDEASVHPIAEPAPKKRRVSESDLLSLKLKDLSSSEEPTAPPISKAKPKMWLNHGLYSGQEPTDSPPKQRKSKNSEKTRSDIKLRGQLPMPIFAGARLIKNGRDYVLPFDIFSPLPPGQPKPDEWRKTNKNVFVGDAASEWKANKKLELSTCMCDEETGCDDNCQNRYMFYECDGGNCRLGPECGNRNFSELKTRTKAGGKYNIGVEVIKTVDRGYGVRSNRTFEPNQIIVEYTGEIITQFECERRMRNVYKNNECYYLMYFDQNMIIDATRGSIARFVNHSCEPNCRMEKWTVAGKPRMALFAGDRGIMTGEELSYDYNFDPYSNKNVQECRCGAINCRGILGPRPKDKDQRAKAEAPSQIKKPINSAGTKRKRAAVDKTTPSQAKKRKFLSSNTVKNGVRKAVTEVSTAHAHVAKMKKSAFAPRMRDAPKTKVKTQKGVKLPTVKTTSRVKAAIPRHISSTSTAPTKKMNQLKRPSPETKKRILSDAVKGSSSKVNPNSSRSKSSSKSKGKNTQSSQTESSHNKHKNKGVKNGVKASTSGSKGNGIIVRDTAEPAIGGKGLGSSMKSVARRMVRSVKGAKSI
ncbi:Histone-lysine N-methyltransferase (Ash1) [Penicillium malachiteum]|nr:Histone-lysine N-methyltransferase (Ash1) [Penicillium malachiteum]